MLIHKGFRFCVYPTEKQIERLSGWNGALRFLWNLGLEQRRMGLSRCGKDKRYPSAFDQINELTDLRAELPWLADVPRDACAQLLVELDQASQRCFKRLGRFPRFKRRNEGPLSVCEPHPKAWSLNGSLLRFPKLGNIRCIVHRPLEGKPKSCTLRREADGWYASILCEISLPDPVPKTEPVVGIDRGVVNIVGDSDDNLVPSPDYHEKMLKRIGRAQRFLRHKTKPSKNKEKAKHRIALMFQKARRQQHHLLHTLSHRYAKSHGTVVIEKLMVTQMTKSAKGTVEAPGRNVAVKSGLNRRILGVAFGLFGEMLRYKLAWSGGVLGEVPAAWSSCTCSRCAHVDPRSRVSRDRFRCTACGFEDHADLNAAKVIKSRWKPSAQPTEALVKLASLRSRKVLRTPRHRPAQSLAL